MGWWRRGAALFIGMASFGSGLWPISLVCLLYLAVSFRRRGSRKEQGEGLKRARHPVRHLFALALFATSALALASGGALSPMAFLAAAMAVELWPFLSARLPVSEVVAVDGSVLLKSKYAPFVWHSLAEVKPGPEPFPRALSSFEGRLLVFTETGKTYALATCRSLGRQQAEASLVGKFRSAWPHSRVGAFLLPLDSTDAEKVLGIRLRRVGLPPGDLADTASRVAGMLVIDCASGRVLRAGSFLIEGSGFAPRVPGRPHDLEGRPLTWEVLDSLGKRTKWPEPDSFSNLLDSIQATSGVPLSERVRSLDSKDGILTLQSLSGEEVKSSRTQLRAILSVYA